MISNRLLGVARAACREALLLLGLAGKLWQRWLVGWLSEGRCVRLAGKICVGPLGVVGGLEVGMLMSEPGQLPVVQHVQLAGNLSVVLTMRLVG